MYVADGRATRIICTYFKTSIEFGGGFEADVAYIDIYQQATTSIYVEI